MVHRRDLSLTVSRCLSLSEAVVSGVLLLGLVRMMMISTAL
jgi:hypothetical protein